MQLPDEKNFSILFMTDLCAQVFQIFQGGKEMSLILAEVYVAYCKNLFKVIFDILNIYFLSFKQVNSRSFP